MRSLPFSCHSAAFQLTSPYHILNEYALEQRVEFWLNRHRIDDAVTALQADPLLENVGFSVGDGVLKFFFKNRDQIDDLGISHPT